VPPNRPRAVRALWDGGPVTEPGPDDPAPPDAAEPPRRARGRVASGARGNALVRASAIQLSWLVKTLVVQAFVIPSSSMHDTLLEGDRVLVSRLVPAPFDVHRGDVVVFADPGGWLTPEEAPRASAVQGALAAVGLAPQQSTGHLIKRVIGLPGDRVAAAGDGSPVTVNGVPVDESAYLAAGVGPSDIPFDVTVPDGALWVLGDNRSSSRDSRWHQGDPGGGAVPVADVVGTAFAVPWPFDRAALLRNPGAAFADVPDPS
jgi:signal peptidase I